MLLDDMNIDKSKNIAIVHDYLIQMGGAEQVVATLHKMYPMATLYTSVCDHHQLMSEIDGANVQDTWMRRLPWISSAYKMYFPLFPLGFKSIGAIDSEVAIISSSGFANWAKFSSATTTICYCHTPARFFWSSDDYLRNETKSRALKVFAKPILRRLRASDRRKAQAIDFFIANSDCVRQRIQSCYGRESVVVHPPVRTGEFGVMGRSEGFYLVASRLVSYKRLDVAIRAFARNGRRLIVVGDGPDRERLQSMAAPNIQFTGWLPRSEVVAYMQACYALVFPGYEDFGITPVEAQACGRPVLAYGNGGALETVQSGVSGLFFDEQTPESLNGILGQFEALKWDAQRIAARAESFNEQRFVEQITRCVERATQEKRHRETSLTLRRKEAYVASQA